MTPVFVGKLVIVANDSGYRPHTENQVLAMPSTVSVTVLPSVPHAREMIIKTHNNGHEVLIHLSMASLSKQPLERDTLRLEMSSEEVKWIIRDAVSKAPNAIGPNNHMGSTMTPSLFGMQKVMQVLERYDPYFLGSMTTGNSQVVCAALGAGVKAIRRKVSLDGTQNEADTHCQFNHIVELAHRNGSTVAIGYPHPFTVHALQQVLHSLLADITLARPGNLLNESQVDISRPNFTPPKNGTPGASRNPFRGVKSYRPKQSLEPVRVSCFFNVPSESTIQSTLVQYIRLQWQGWQ